MRIFWVVFGVVVFGFCQVASCAPLLSLKELQTKPKGVARDFYIWEFITHKDTSLKESLEAYKLVYNEIPKLKAALEKKGFHAQMPKNIACSKLAYESLKNKDAQCIAYALRLGAVPAMSQAQVDFFVSKLKATHPNIVQKIQILRSKDIKESMLNASAQIFSEVYNSLSYNQRAQIFGTPTKPESLKILANANRYSFNRILQNVILDGGFLEFKKSISKADLSGIKDANTLFLLGINEVRIGTKDKAMKYFALSRTNAADPFFRDRAIFWQYLLSDNVAFLNDLQASEHADIFSIYANQKLKTTPNYQIISHFENLSTTNPKLDIKDPFAWQILRDNMPKESSKLKAIAKDFSYELTIPHLAFVNNRINKYSINYFIMPYTENLKWRDNSQKAMALAVAKQESTFLPALVSRSYALGMMQIMPFNVEPFARKLKKTDITLESMFDPVIAYEFGRMYLDELNREFSHPLFSAYAYNGGPGFLRKTLSKKRLFIKSRKYEPWISLELLPVEETRFYGMRVLANYVIYQQILGVEVDIESLLKKTLRY